MIILEFLLPNFNIHNYNINASEDSRVSRKEYIGIIGRYSNFYNTLQKLLGI